MGAHLLAGNVVTSVILVVLVIVFLLNLAAVGRQPVQKTELSFKVRELHVSVEKYTALALQQHDCVPHCIVTA